MYKFKKFKSKIAPLIVSAQDETLKLKNYGNVLDFTSGWTGYASLGHNNKIILNAVKKQMTKFCHIDYNEFSNPLLEQLSKKIVEFAPNKNKKIWYSGNSGSEALEAAMKLSYQAHYAKGNKKKLNLYTDLNLFMVQHYIL